MGLTDRSSPGPDCNGRLHGLVTLGLPRRIREIDKRDKQPFLRETGALRILEGNCPEVNRGESLQGIGFLSCGWRTCSGRNGLCGFVPSPSLPVCRKKWMWIRARANRKPAHCVVSCGMHDEAASPSAASPQPRAAYLIELLTGPVKMTIS